METPAEIHYLNLHVVQHVNLGSIVLSSTHLSRHIEKLHGAKEQMLIIQKKRLAADFKRHMYICKLSILNKWGFLDYKLT